MGLQCAGPGCVPWPVLIPIAKPGAPPSERCFQVESWLDLNAKLSKILLQFIVGAAGIAVGHHIPVEDVLPVKNKSFLLLPHAK